MSVSVNGHKVRSAGRQEGPPPAIGQLIGKYRVVRDLGTAGMARVFLATLEGPGGFSKAYVIKRISRAQVPNPRVTSLLANEATVAAAIDHVNVVRLLEFFQDDDGSYFLVIEHVDGVSLDHLLRAARRAGEPLGPDVAAEIGLALARALAHVHGWGWGDGRPGDLLHGDVAASNVLISREGTVKLTNVGVANSAVATQSGAGLNAKLSYMSPEQLAGTRADQRSDLYSLGMILYEVATGVRLGGGESPGVAELEALAGVASFREPVTETGAGPNFAAIVAKLLRRDPAGRHQSAAALVAALEALRASRPASVRTLPVAEAVRACLVAAEAAPPPLPTPPAEPVAPFPLAMPAAARAPDPYGLPPLAVDADEPPVSLVLAVSLACLIGSLIFWFAVF